MTTTVDLRTLRLRPGEVRTQTVEVELDPFVLGGQRYEAVPGTIPVELQLSQASGATVFDLELSERLVERDVKDLGGQRSCVSAHRDFVPAKRGCSSSPLLDSQ